MKADDLALVAGWPHTRATLRRWNTAPLRRIAPWAALSLLIALALLGATWIVAVNSVADPSWHRYPGVTSHATNADYYYVLRRNLTVLALHSLACVAGFIAGWTPPGKRSQLPRFAAPAAILFVSAATIFSLITQAEALGGQAADLAALLHVTPLRLLVALAPHALLELFAVFLPLAAWTLASRRGAWDELLAATIITTLIAIPLVFGAAAIEIWVTPGVLIGIAG